VNYLENTSKMQQAQQLLKSYRQQTLVTWTSSDHMISHWLQGTQMLLLWTILLWWRPAVSHHSVLKFFIVHFCWGSLTIRYQPCTKPELNPNPHGGTAKKIMSSPYKEYFQATQKEKIKWPLNPKPYSPCRMLFLVLRKDGRAGYARIQPNLTLHQIRTPN
jgi:hypothetical protein